MFSPFEGVKLLLATTFLCLIQHYCYATDCASSCGNIKINYPFRLKTDPGHCGNKIYELACEDNAVIVYLGGKFKGPAVGYPVRAINYNNMTIRLAYPNIQMDNCALPIPTDTSVSAREFSYYMYTAGYSRYYEFPQLLSRTLCFISCPYPIAGSLHVYNSRCNLKRYWYWYLEVWGDSFYGSELENWCRIEAIHLTSLLPAGAKNISYIDVIHSLSYGFELTWEYACCTSKATRKIYNCSRSESLGPFYCDDINWNSM